MRRRPSTGVVANPILVGAVTVLVVIVAVFLAYNANSGLPFVPTYELRAQVPDASELVPGNEVLMGGTRVGVVESIDARRRGDRWDAILALELEADAGPLRDDSLVRIRYRSNVGLKYVEITPGTAGRELPDGSLLSVSQAEEPVDLDDVVATYDEPTREALSGLLEAFGGGLAGRGAALNRTIEELPGALDDLAVVGRVLRGPRTDLDGFVDGLAAAASATAPVARELGELATAGATTFGALAAEGDAYGEIFDEAAATGRSGVAALRATRPLLTELTGLAVDARPAARALPRTARRVARALGRSGPPLRRSQELAAPLERLVGELRAMSRQRSTTGALQRLTDVVRDTVPVLRHVNPIQTRCNALGIWTRNVPSVVSEGDATGTWFRFAPIMKLDESLPSASRARDLHNQTLPDNGQGGECESGNEDYVPGQVVGTVPGVQPGRTDDTPRGTLARRVAAEGAVNP